MTKVVRYKGLKEGRDKFTIDRTLSDEFVKEEIIQKELVGFIRGRRP